MKELVKLFILPIFILFLAVPTFAQEEVALEEELALTEEAGEGVITGGVTTLDADAGTVSVKVTQGSDMTFTVVDGETILWRGIEDIELSDIKVGEEAEVGYYTNENGDLIASWVDVLVEEEFVPVEALEAGAGEAE
ncbi:MAG: hypothetical protein KKG01_07945 [Candidatus Omnitrophica bacterium]|nr:hypothetical protein [Candidatus Omnitrophota bacterium]MBU4590842.1 hypothetical protein [Candidatus Omnitrophota bacterium]